MNSRFFIFLSLACKYFPSTFRGVVNKQAYQCKGELSTFSIDNH